MLALWRRFPVVVRAVLTGFALATAGTGPWAVLVSLNTKHGSAVPWAVPPTALYLWFYWRYVRGAGWPRATAASRRENCRANRLPDETWGAAIVAGILGLVVVLALQGVTSRLVALPEHQDLDPSKFPLATVLAWVLMSAAVAGVVEESAFRGYMQRPIERRHGPTVAILVTGLMFGLLHFTHPEVTLALMPFYLVVAVVYGTLAHLTDSILPGMVLHAGGNVLAAFNLFAAGRSEWQGFASPKPLIWESGADASFWFSVAAMLIAGAAAFWAYAALARVARSASLASRAD